MENEPALSADQLTQIGAAVVSLCGTFQALGHVSPVGSVVDYVARPADEAGGFVWDMFRICEFTGDAAARDRLADFAERHGILDLIAEAVAR